MEDDEHDDNADACLLCSWSFTFVVSKQFSRPLANAQPGPAAASSLMRLILLDGIFEYDIDMQHSPLSRTTPPDSKLLSGW